MKHFTLALLSFLYLPSIIYSQLPTTIVRTFPASKGNAEKIQELSPGLFLVHGKAFGHGYLAVLDEEGTEMNFKPLKDAIGGIRSEITDAVITSDAIYFIGDCDSCSGFPDDPERKILYLKTDKNLNILKKEIVDPPLDTAKAYIVWGYQELRQDGNNLISLIQLTYEEDDTTFTDFSLAQIDTGLNLQFHAAYDFHRLDNISDLVVTSDAYYVLSWGISGFFLTADTTRLMRFNKTLAPPTPDTRPDLVWERSYRGIGFKALRMPTGDWVIGGSSTEQFLTGVGPQSMLLQTDGITGDIKNKNMFGGDQNLIDAIRDLKLLPSGEIMAAVVEDAAYPDTMFIDDFVFRLYAYPDSWTHPKTGKIMRFNATTLQASSTVVFPNPDTSDIILRSVWPLTPDGNQFVACGQYRRMPVFFTRAVITSFVNNPHQQVAVQTGSTSGGENFVENPQNEDEKIDEEPDDSTEIVVGLFPNPVRRDESVHLNLEKDISKFDDIHVEIVNVLGKVIYATSGRNNQFEFPAPAQKGIYFVMIRAGKAVLKTKKFLVMSNE